MEQFASRPERSHKIRNEENQSNLVIRISLVALVEAMS